MEQKVQFKNVETGVVVTAVHPFVIEQLRESEQYKEVTEKKTDKK